MPRPALPPLSRRERQIMDIIYAHGQATAMEILTAIPEPVSNSAVRTFLRILEDKGHLTHREVAGKYVYLPTTPREQAARSALQRVLATFFGGSLEKAVLAHMTDPATKLSPQELKRLTDLIRQAKKRGD